ncbi:MAG: GtrA family protein [Deltaproteobacteria bacterium]|nr:GtrA family protein [Deltaproteobacteria bacterium]
MSMQQQTTVCPNINIDSDIDDVTFSSSQPSASIFKIEIARLARSQLSSLIATGVDFAIVALLLSLRVHYLIAAVLGVLIGAGIDFSIKKWWAFAARGGMLHRQMLRYAMVSATSAGLNALIAYILVDGLQMQEFTGVAIAAAIVGIAWNYPMQRFHVFAGAFKTVAAK